jgi:hypothetical protein
MYRISARLLLASATFAALASVGCGRPSGKAFVRTKEQEQQIAAHVLTAPPANLQHKMEVNFENKIRLLGYDISGEPKKGAAVDVTMYWRVDEPVSGDWKVFVHFEAPGKRRQPFDHDGIGGLYPVQNWKKGEIIQDTVHVEVPSDWPEGPSQLLVGFFDWDLYQKTQKDLRLTVLDGKGQPTLGDDNKPADKMLLTSLTIGVGEAARPAGAAP